MSSLSSLYIKKETLQTLLKTLNAKGQKGIELTLSINDTTNNYGQNITAYVSQSKEERESGKNKFYTGNGKVFWTDGKITKAEAQQTSASSNSSNSNEDTDDLPF